MTVGFVYILLQHLGLKNCFKAFIMFSDMVENYGKKAKKINITTVEINPNFVQRKIKINTWY